MSDAVAWTVAAVFAAVFLTANAVNLHLVFGKGSSGSPVAFVGGIAGALAVAVVPLDGARDYWPVPLVLDLGTGPLLLVTGVMLAFQAVRSPAFLRRLPFLRYLAPKPRRESGPESSAVTGCILGTAVGDAMGLACEGLSGDRRRRLFGPEIRYRMLLGKGLTSDDTEHTCMVAQSLIETAGWANDKIARKFQSKLAWRLRGWLLLLPAGIGSATLRAILKLWIGFPARFSGVRSAGNGPAMRVAIIGVACADDPDRAELLTIAATRITHTHPDAEQGALAIMLAARFSATAEEDIGPGEFLAAYISLVGADAGLVEPVRRACDSAARAEAAAVFAETIGCGRGVSGWIRHTVPVALQVWLTHQQDYRGAVETMVELGGDTDTTAAIVGALVGARVGPAGIPGEWLRDLREWPRSVAWMSRLGERLAKHSRGRSVGRPVSISLAGLALRNVLFLMIVLVHGFRRLLPPY